MPMLYLASQSPRRRKLLAQLHRPFRVVRSTYRETHRRGLTPSAAVMRNAVGKVRHAVLPRPPKSLRAAGWGAEEVVIGADTLLYFRGRLIGKPASMHQARRTLQALSGKSHWVYTGLCLREARTGRLRVSYDKTKVAFKPLTQEAVARIIARVRPLDKAGGYAIQADHGELIARIDGSRSNVMGLPLELLRRELVQLTSGG